MPDANTEAYMATRSMESKRALEWMSAYNSNPDLASSLLPLFRMGEDEIRFIMRTLNSLNDSLYFYNLALTTKEPSTKKKPSKKRTAPIVEV